MGEHSPKFETVKYYYDNGYWSIERVAKAVTTPKSGPWITVEEFEEITGEEYPVRK